MAKDKITHLAIIMDGNGRWAETKSAKRSFGHKKGIDAVKKAITGCINNDIKYLTLYAFSYENWQRPEEEVSFLMELFSSYIDIEIQNLNKRGIRLKFIGELDLLPSELNKKIKNASEITKENSTLILTVALSYSSRKEIVKAVNAALKNGASEISEEILEQNLYTYDIPSPDIVVRTSGEQRISNFLLWQIAYSEFLFMDKFWPDFDEKDIEFIANEYNKRNRRYGKI